MNGLFSHDPSIRKGREYTKEDVVRRGEMGYSGEALTWRETPPQSPPPRSLVGERGWTGREAVNLLGEEEEGAKRNERDERIGEERRVVGYFQLVGNAATTGQERTGVCVTWGPFQCYHRTRRAG